MVGFEALGFEPGITMPDTDRFYGAMAEVDPYFNIFPVDFTRRGWDDIASGAVANYNMYETSSITQDNAKSLEYLADRLEKWRMPITGKRLPWAPNNVAKTFRTALNDNINGQSKAVALYLAHSAKYGGLKNPNGPIDFENLKDPGLLIKESRGMTSYFNNDARSTEVIDTLTDVAIKSQNSHLAALLLKQAGHGIGKDEAGIRKILIDSRRQMGEGQYARFITNTSMAFEKLHGERLDDFITKEYSSIGNTGGAIAGAATGFVAGLIAGHGILSIPAAIVGAIIGGVVGAKAGETDILPANAEGQAILNKIDFSHTRDNRTNGTMIGLMYG